MSSHVTSCARVAPRVSTGSSSDLFVVVVASDPHASPSNTSIRCAQTDRSTCYDISLLVISLKSLALAGNQDSDIPPTSKEDANFFNSLRSRRKASKESRVLSVPWVY
jgi:hypothetical protein